MACAKKNVCKLVSRKNQICKYIYGCIYTRRFDEASPITELLSFRHIFTSYSIFYLIHNFKKLLKNLQSEIFFHESDADWKTKYKLFFAFSNNNFSLAQIQHEQMDPNPVISFRAGYREMRIHNPEIERTERTPNCYEFL